MERYSEYKDSGEQWLGEIPSHWEVRKMKYTFRERSEKGYPNEPLLAATQNHGVICKSSYENRTVEASKGLDTLKLVEKGDFVISLRSFQGGLEYAYDRGIISPAYTILQPTHILSDYFKYLAKSTIYISLLKSVVTGIREGQNIDYSKLKEYLLPIPPQDEQVMIGKHLDRVTSQLDEAIAQQQRMIDLLNERKQIIIQHAVTKGLDPKAEMVESGVEWIGMMPKGWKATPLRFVFEIRNGYTPSKNDPSFWTNGTIPWYRMEDIRKNGRILKEAHQYVTRKAVNGKGTFSAGSYIMAICTASIGEHAMLIADSLANQRFANFKIYQSLSDKYLPMFLFYYFYVIGDFCRHNENSTCFQYVDMPALKRFPILMPSIEEQQKIVEFLDSNLAYLNKSLQQIEHRITLLRERKQIIINEVVTGKVKVS